MAGTTGFLCLWQEKSSGRPRRKGFYLLQLQCKDFLIGLVGTGQQVCAIPYVCYLQRPLTLRTHITQYWHKTQDSSQ
jgi:hypothetical protein